MLLKSLLPVEFYKTKKEAKSSYDGLSHQNAYVDDMDAIKLSTIIKGSSPDLAPFIENHFVNTIFSLICLFCTKAHYRDINLYIFTIFLNIFSLSYQSE